MKTRILTAAILLFAGVASAQTAERSYNLNDKGCATLPDPAQVQEVYDFVQHNPMAYAKPTDGVVDTIPISFHIVGKDNGTGYYDVNKALTLLCNLNVRYAPVQFYFALQWPIHYINNSSYYEHDFTTGAQMMDQYNVNNTVNVYFVDDPSGACGYYSPWKDGVAIAKMCASVTSTTLTHELGHFFSLPHTFYGWEGGNEPEDPEKVTRDAGANCNSAGDGFCDTEADFISDRWQCPYNGTMTDENGDLYHPDSSIYMSYSIDACMSRFSGQEINKMHNNRAGAHSNLVADYPAWTPLFAPEVVYPTDTMYANQQTLVWHKTPGAEYYQVRISLAASSGITKQAALTTDTSLNLTFALSNNIKYVATISPLSSVNVCREFASSDTFTYSSSNTPLGLLHIAAGEGSISVAPNPATGSSVGIQMAGIPAGQFDCRVSGISGQVIQRTSVMHPGGNQLVQLNVADIPAGLYFITLSGKAGQYVQKLVIQR